MSKPLSNEDIKRRKKIQAGVSQATGGLGLTALGITGLKSKTGQRALKGAFRRMDRPMPKRLKAKTLTGPQTAVLSTGAGLGGLGSFNFASYTKAEGDKGKRKVQKSSSFSAFGIDHGH